MTTTMLPNEKFTKQYEMEDDKIRRCLQSEDGKFLVERLLGMYHRHMSQLKTAREPVDIYRYQGRIESLELILKMREGEVI
jgi:hypothetical protein